MHMYLSRSRYLSVLFVAGCATTPASTAPTAPPSSLSGLPAANAPRRAPTSTTPDALCAAFSLEQRAAIDAAFKAGPLDASDPLDEASARTELSKAGSGCWATKGGAWATLIEWVSPRPWSGFTGLTARVLLVHLGVDGSRGSILVSRGTSASADKDNSNFYFSSVDRSAIEPPTLFDFDGDGVDEIVLTLDGGYHEGQAWTQAQVWTTAHGAVIPYAPASHFRFDGAKDVDGDGRPDLVGFGEYDAVLSGCCSGFDHTVRGPPLVYHSLPDGTFSSTDSVAVAAARSSCPASPVPVIAKRNPVWAESDVLFRVACARLWGRPVSEIEAELEAAVPKGDDGCDHSTCASRTEVLQTAEQWADLPPPVTLSDRR